MKIDRHTKTKDILPLLTKERIEDLLGKVSPVPVKRTLWEMTIEEFSEVVDGTWFEKIFVKEKRFLNAMGMYKTMYTDLENFGKYVESFKVKKTAEEKAAAEGIDFPDLPTRMCIDIVRFFSLHSFEEAEKHSVTDWLVIYQDEASSAIFQRRHSDIMAAKRKVKK